MRALLVAAAVIAAAAVGGPAAAADGGLTLKGTLTKAKPGTTVLVVAADGSSASARVAKSGRFTVKVPKGPVAKRMNPHRGRGATVQILRNGKYVGPVLFDAKGTKGYGRLASGLPRRVDLGVIRVDRKGFGILKKAPRHKLLDTRRPIRLRKGVPVGAGTQGATGRLRSVTATASAGLPKNESALGSDADQDGVPNLADVDMNGDQVLDAAQADSPLQTSDGPLSGNEVLPDRPMGNVSFAKILDMDQRRAINTNRNPGLTWDTLSDYLMQELKIEALVPPGDIRALLCGSPDDNCAAAQSVARLTMDCTTLSYCQPGSPAIIRAEPDTPLDGKPLSTLLDATGRIVMPQDTHAPGSAILETGFLLSFMPKVTGAEDLQFAGDSFEFTLYDAKGTALARQAKVLTSSVATAPEWASIGGQPAPESLELNGAIPITLDQPLRLSFFRPQRLVDTSGVVPRLQDRGGLTYSAYMYTTGPGNDFYWCRADQVRSASEDLANITPQEQAGGREMLYDTNVNPTNGGTLAFDLDVANCLSDPATGPGSPPPPGSTLAVELESADADGNRTRSRVYVVVP
jgi:hypothetical protein